mmetsp:Transcript_8787/g.21746  ORF Transcript_8787/g.21746 Transcript_8787/m.21746 type:complete len:239 (-) Transcript_8787:1179-1895(-)
MPEGAGDEEDESATRRWGPYSERESSCTSSQRAWRHARCAATSDSARCSHSRAGRAMAMPGSKRGGCAAAGAEEDAAAAAAASSGAGWGTAPLAAHAIRRSALRRHAGETERRMGRRRREMTRMSHGHACWLASSSAEISMEMVCDRISPSPDREAASCLISTLHSASPPPPSGARNPGARHVAAASESCSSAGAIARGIATCASGGNRASKWSESIAASVSINPLPLTACATTAPST